MIVRRKSYTAEFKVRAVDFSLAINPETGRENGNRNAARKFEVDESMIRQWKSNVDALRQTNWDRRAFRSSSRHKIIWPSLEFSLMQLLNQQPIEICQMKVRRFNKIESRKNQHNPEELLRRFDIKNVVKKNSEKPTDKEKESQVIVKEEVDASLSIDTQSESGLTWDEKTLRVKFPQRALRSINSGYSLRTSRRIANRCNQGEDDNARSEFTDEIKAETMDAEDGYESVSFAKESPSSSKRLSYSPAPPRKRAPMTRKSTSPFSIKKRKTTDGSFSFPKMSDIDCRSARYGWALQDISQFPIVHKEDPEYPFESPDDYLCYNDKKSWAGKYTMCIGQKNLCKWI